MKRQPTKREKIFVHYTFDKELETRIYKKIHLKLNNNFLKTIKNSQRICWTFLQRYTVANKHMKRCLTSLAIIEIQVNATLRCHLVPIKTAITKKTDNKYL